MLGSTASQKGSLDELLVVLLDEQKGSLDELSFRTAPLKEALPSSSILEISSDGGCDLVPSAFLELAVFGVSRLAPFVISFAGGTFAALFWPPMWVASSAAPPVSETVESIVIVEWIVMVGSISRSSKSSSDQSLGSNSFLKLDLILSPLCCSWLCLRLCLRS